MVYTNAPQSTSVNYFPLQVKILFYLYLFWRKNMNAKRKNWEEKKILCPWKIFQVSANIFGMRSCIK